jgi:3-oxoacyl-[acyl-carrier protein] reductase
MATREVAVITGSGRPWSLGRACAVQLASKGVDVAVVDLRADWGNEAVAAVEEVGAKGLFALTDISRREDVAAMVATVFDEFGRIDTLINSAGIVENRPLGEITDEHFDRVIDINLRGTILTCQAIAPIMRRLGRGRIINVASGAAVRPLQTTGVYSASKAAVVGFSRVLALELAEEAIVVNVVAPGTMGNAMGSEEGPEVRGDVGSASLAASLPRQPFGSLPTTAQVAELITYLATSDSPILAGQTLHANAAAWMV